MVNGLSLYLNIGFNASPDFYDTCYYKTHWTYNVAWNKMLGRWEMKKSGYRNYERLDLTEEQEALLWEAWKNQDDDEVTLDL